MPNLSSLVKDNIVFYIIGFAVLVTIIYFASKYVKHEIKRGIIKDRKKRSKQNEKTMAHEQYYDDDDDDIDSYINPVDINDDFKQQDNEQEIHRFTKDNIMQRDLLDRIH